MVSLHAAFAAMMLSSAGQTVLLDFYADWCGPCKAMEPTVHALQEKGIPVQKVNIEQNPSLAAQYSVRSVPCFIMLVDGQEVDREMGGTSYSRLEKMFKKGQLNPAQNPSPGLLAQNAASPSWQMAQANGLPVSGTTPGAAARRMDSNIIPVSYQTPAGGMPQFDRGASLDARLIAASVRLRIEDASGNSCGSGTIIDARAGNQGLEALILTCGHIFRDSQGKGKIEVDLFGPYFGQRVDGRLVSYDLTRDVGLVAIRAPGPMAAARLAPQGYKTQKGDHVASVGCDNGKDPAVRQSYVTSLNRYTGPANLQVAGQPTEGRSGGGLFSADCMVIGVCNARDPQDQEGYYAALETICAQLDQAGLAFAYQSPQGWEGFNNMGGAAPIVPAVNQTTTSPGMPQPILPVSATNILPENAMQQMMTAGSQPGGLNPSEQASLDEIRRRLKEGAEVVCVIRSRRSPDAKSEVIMLDKASPEFLQQMAAEAQAKNRQETSLELPSPRPKPAVEWSANPGSNATAWRAGQ